jgi:uncharacterized membrane protein
MVVELTPPETPVRNTASDEKQTGRVEAFSDGVIAIAITLLAFELRAPRDLPEGTSLLSALVDEWPVYLGFITSFLTIFVMWINHHRLFMIIRRVDTPLNVLNGLLMMGISVTPFATSLLTAYARDENLDDQRVAGLVLGGLFVLISVVYNALWRYASYKGRLLVRDVNPAKVQAITRQYRFGPLYYVGCALLSLIDARLSLVAFLLVAVSFLLSPDRTSPQGE